MNRRKILAAAIAAAAAPISGLHAQGVAWPTRPIRLVVPINAGGSADIVARVLAEKLQTRLSQPVVVDNKPGASTVIGTNYVLRAPADGYTLYMTNNLVGLMPITSPNTARYHPLQDFTMIGRIGSSVGVLVTNTTMPFTSVPEMIAHAKKHPGQLAFATTGIGSADHLGGELLAQAAGVKFNFVPYTGGALAMQDVASGVAQLRYDGLATALPFITSGKVRVLAVVGDKRDPRLPNVPAQGEVLPGTDWRGYFGIIGPKGVPDKVVERFNRELNETLALPDVAERLRGAGINVSGGTPEDLAKTVQASYEMWTRLVKQLGLKTE